MNTQTIADLEEAIAAALETVAPAGLRPIVELRENGRKKRRTSSASTWNPQAGEIVVTFEAAPPASRRAQAKKSAARAKPAAHANPMAALLAALEQAESEPGRTFIALKYFRDDVLPRLGHAWTASPDTRQQLITQAIHEGRILTSKVPNPKSPLHPTTAIKLNPRFRATPSPTRRFHAVAASGEPLSTTLLRDRGAR